MKQLDKLPAVQIAALQSVGLFSYILLIASVISNGNKLFGSVPNFFGPVLFMTLFLTSALITGAIALLYPFWLFWEHKNTKKALHIIGYETLFMTLLTVVILLVMVIF